MFLDTVSFVGLVFLTPNLLDLYLFAFSTVEVNSDNWAGFVYVSLSSISPTGTLSIFACCKTT